MQIQWIQIQNKLIINLHKEVSIQKMTDMLKSLLIRSRGVINTLIVSCLSGNIWTPLNEIDKC